MHEKIDVILLQSRTIEDYIEFFLKAKDDSEKRLYPSRAFTPLDVITETCDYIFSDVTKKYSFLENEFGQSENLNTISDNIDDIKKAMKNPAASRRVSIAI